MQMIRGSFQGTGAAFYLCLGTLPSWIKIWNLEDTSNLEQMIWWSQAYRKTAKGFDGFRLNLLASSMTASDEVAAAGLTPYVGGDVGDGTETYLMRDPEPNKFAKGAIAEINRWVLDTPASKTGHFNSAVCTTAGPDKVGIGSVIKIDSGAGVKSYVITALSNDGDAANDVTLDLAAPSGIVTHVGGMYDWVRVPSGVKTSPGIYCAITDTINVDTEMAAFEAMID